LLDPPLDQLRTDLTVAICGVTIGVVSDLDSVALSIQFVDASQLDHGAVGLNTWLHSFGHFLEPRVAVAEFGLLEESGSSRLKTVDGLLPADRSGPPELRNADEDGPNPVEC